MTEEIINDAKVRMDKAIAKVRSELVHIRTGKATTQLLDGISVESYGSKMPLNQVASINIPEPRSISITPWDKSLLSAIEKEILASDLGLTPNNDGTNIRLSIPQLTEERRKDLVKLIHRFGEDGKIAIRNVRRDANEHFKKLEKDKEIAEDVCYTAIEEIQTLTDKEIANIDVIVKAKDVEIMTV